uniref:Uncharacterized protein n=1 Tax=Oryza nivara TaxID=4536 RepID=A0A0E0I7V7_ORYNI
MANFAIYGPEDRGIEIPKLQGAMAGLSTAPEIGVAVVAGVCVVSAAVAAAAAATASSSPEAPPGAKHQLVIGGDEIPLWLRSRGSGDAVEGGGGAEMEGIAG